MSTMSREERIRRKKKRKKTQSESNLSDYGDLVCRVPGGGSDCESDKEGCGVL